jgi:hypothetical protein
LQIRAIISGKLFSMAGLSRSITVVFTGPLLGELIDETDYLQNCDFRDDRSITYRGRGTFRARRRLKHTTFRATCRSTSDTFDRHAGGGARCRRGAQARLTPPPPQILSRAIFWTVSDLLAGLRPPSTPLAAILLAAVRLAFLPLAPLPSASLASPLVASPLVASPLAVWLG